MKRRERRKALALGVIAEEIEHGEMEPSAASLHFSGTAGVHRVRGIEATAPRA